MHCRCEISKEQILFAAPQPHCIPVPLKLKDRGVWEPGLARGDAKCRDCRVMLRILEYFGHTSDIFGHTSDILRTYSDMCIVIFHVRSNSITNTLTFSNANTLPETINCHSLGLGSSHRIKQHVQFQSFNMNWYELCASFIEDCYSMVFHCFSWCFLVYFSVCRMRRLPSPWSEASASSHPARVNRWDATKITIEVHQGVTTLCHFACCRFQMLPKHSEMDWPRMQRTHFARQNLANLSKKWPWNAMAVFGVEFCSLSNSATGDESWHRWLPTNCLTPKFRYLDPLDPWMSNRVTEYILKWHKDHYLYIKVNEHQ